MEFMLVVVAAKLGAAIPPGSPSSHPLAQRHFANHLSCEQAASIATPPPGTKLACIPTGGSGGLIHTAG